MSWIQQLKDFIAPTTIKCNEGASDSLNSFDPMQPEDEFQAHVPSMKHRVPGFQGYFNSVLMITQNPEIIKGFRFQFNLPLSEYFTFSHAWSIPNSGTQQESNPMNPMMPPAMAKPTYTFITQLVQDIRGQEPYTMMMGKADNEGKIESVFVRKINQNVTLKLNGSFQSSNVEQGMIIADLDVETKDSNNCFRWGQGIFQFNTMQRINKNLIAGFDYTNLISQKISCMSYGFKAFVKNHSIFAQYMGLHDQYNLAYMVPIKKGTHFVSHYKYDGREKRSTTIVGLKQRYESSDILATITSNYQISTSLNLRNPNFSVKLCAIVDYMKQKYTFGYGVVLGQTM